MYPIYRQLINLQGFKVLTKFPEKPAENLAVADSEVLHDIPLLIFTKQQLPYKNPVVDYSVSTPYEKTALKGANDTLSLDNFVTDDFSLGVPFTAI